MTDPGRPDLLGAARASALHALDRADHLLGIGAGAELLTARLAPGTFPLADQIAVTGSFARRATLALVRDDFDPGLDWDDGEPALRALLDRIRGEVKAAEGTPLPLVVHRAGEAELSQNPADYLFRFALPNLWFHLSMAYAILRTGGAPLGKADFDGLHAYPAP